MAMARSIASLGAEYVKLQSLEREFAEVDDGSRDDVNSPRYQSLTEVGERLAAVVREVTISPAVSTDDLMQKARIGLDWINSEGDIADRIAFSICRDVVECLQEQNDGTLDRPTKVARQPR
jgi:hypothetical protein